jgi:hypothetical protein
MFSPCLTQEVAVSSVIFLLTIFGSAHVTVIDAQFKRPTELPRGWVACKGADGKIYYQDNESKVTQWVIPTERLPKGWRAMTARNGRTYYRDDTTKSTT